MLRRCQPQEPFSELDRSDPLFEEIKLPSYGTLVFGRDPKQVDVLLRSKVKNMISRNHASMRRGDDQKVWLFCQSLNGATVNGIKRTRFALNYGDVIGFGGAHGVKDNTKTKAKTDVVYKYIQAPEQENQPQQSNTEQQLKRKHSLQGDDIDGDSRASASNGDGAAHNYKRSKIPLVSISEDDTNNNSNIPTQPSTSSSSNSSSNKETQSQQQTIPHLLTTRLSTGTNKSDHKPIVIDDKSCSNSLQNPIIIGDDEAGPSENKDVQDAAEGTQRSNNGKAAKVLAEGISEDLKCVICFDLMAQAHALPCSHTFCFQCITDWFKSKNKNTCPECREKVQARDAVPVRSLDKTIEKIAEKVLDDDDLGEFRGRVDEAKTAVADQRKKNTTKSATPSSRQQTLLPFFMSTYDEDSDDYEQSNWTLEYSPSGRARCRTCNNTIPYGVIRWNENYSTELYNGNRFHHWLCQLHEVRIPNHFTQQDRRAIQDRFATQLP